MAKIFDKIVQSATEPSKNDIWLKDGQLKAFQNGQWKSLSPQSEGGEGGGEEDNLIQYTLKTSAGYLCMANDEGIDFNKEEEKVKLYIELTDRWKTIEPIIVIAKRVKSTQGTSNNKYYLDINIEPTTLKAIFYNDNNAEGVVSVGIKSGLYEQILGHGYKLTTYDIVEYPKYNKEYPIFTTKDNNQNKQILESINTTQCYLFVEKKLYLSFYNNGTITTFADNKLKQYNVNIETGEITESISIDLNTLAGLEARIAALEGA